MKLTEDAKTYECGFIGSRCYVYDPSETDLCESTGSARRLSPVLLKKTGRCTVSFLVFLKGIS